MLSIWDKRYIEINALKEGEEIRIPSNAKRFYKDVMKQYEISPEKEETLNKVNLLGQKYGVYIWYSSKAQELLDCYEIIEAMEESLKYNQDKIKEIDYKIDQVTRKEEWEQKFNDLVNGNTYIDTTEETKNWLCYMGEFYPNQATTKDQLELKRKEVISNAIKISELEHKKVKIEDSGKLYQIDTKIKSLEEKNKKLLERINKLTLYTYYEEKIKGVKDLKESIKNREKEIKELNYGYVKEVVYKIAYETIKTIMSLEEAILKGTK